MNLLFMAVYTFTSFNLCFKIQYVSTEYTNEWVIHSLPCCNGNILGPHIPIAVPFVVLTVQREKPWANNFVHKNFSYQSILDTPYASSLLSSQPSQNPVTSCSVYLCFFNLTPVEDTHDFPEL